DLNCEKTQEQLLSILRKVGIDEGDFQCFIIHEDLKDIIKNSTKLFSNIEEMYNAFNSKKRDLIKSSIRKFISKDEVKFLLTDGIEVFTQYGKKLYNSTEEIKEEIYNRIFPIFNSEAKSNIDRTNIRGFYSILNQDFKIS